MQAFKNLRLAVRLGIGFGTLAAALLVVAVLGATKLAGVQGHVTTLADRDAVALARSGDLLTSTAETGHLVAQHLYVHDGELKVEDAIQARLDAQLKGDGANAQALAKLVKGTPAEPAMNKWMKVGLRMVAAADKAVARSRKETVAKSDNRDKSRAIYATQVAPGVDAAMAAGKQLQTAVRHMTDATHQQTKAEVSSSTRLIWIVALLALAVAAGIAVLITRSVTRPVSGLVQRLRSLNDHCLTDLGTGLQAVAAGDLTVDAQPVTTPLEVDSRDELGQLAETFNGMLARAQGGITAYNDMRAQLGELIGNVSQSAETVSAASQQMASTSDEAGRAVGEIANAVGDVAQGAERQVRMVENTRTAVQEAARAAGQSAQTAAETAQAAEEARDAAREGVEAAEHATGAIRQVAETSAQVAKAIEDLSARSERIGGIVTTITGIAEQTNLLALNAAIEAARAGEQGRGFAVVAEEVRKLAEESQDAAGQISELIGEIQGQTQQVVGVVSEGAARTEEGVATVERTRDAFERIDTAVEAVGARIAEIAAATEQIAAEAQRAEGDIAEVASVAEQSSASAEQVSASTQQTSASTQEIASSAGELARTAEELNTLVSRFRV
jgi:methyl-accepting chemotaxis protein